MLVQRTTEITLSHIKNIFVYNYTLNTRKKYRGSAQRVENCILFIIKINNETEW